MYCMFKCSFYQTNVYFFCEHNYFDYFYVYFSSKIIIEPVIDILFLTKNSVGASIGIKKNAKIIGKLKF